MQAAGYNGARTVYKSFAHRLLYFIGYMSGKGKIVTSIFCQSLYISLKKASALGITEKRFRLAHRLPIYFWLASKK